MTDRDIKAQATRFLVWRTYHDLKKDLGRAPSDPEIAGELDIPKSTARYHRRELDTCAGISQGNRYGDDRSHGDPPDVCQLLKQNGYM